MPAFDAMAEQLQQLSMSLWDQRLALEKRDANSFMWASLAPSACTSASASCPASAMTANDLKSRYSPP